MRNFLKTYDPANPEMTQLPPFAISWGTTVPSNGDGNDGDFYFEYNGSTTNTIYKKISGVWETSLVEAANPTLSNLVSPTAINQDLNLSGHSLHQVNVISGYAGVWTLFAGFTADGSSVDVEGDVFVLAGHGLTTGQPIRFNPSFTTGVLPSPLVLSTVYYAAVVDDNTFGLFYDAGLTSVVILTDTGSGTIYFDALVPTDTTAIDVLNRKLFGNDGTTAGLDWYTPGEVSPGVPSVTTLGSPSKYYGNIFTNTVTTAVRLLNSGTSAVAVSDFKLLADTTDEIGRAHV